MTRDEDEITNDQLDFKIQTFLNKTNSDENVSQSKRKVTQDKKFEEFRKKLYHKNTDSSKKNPCSKTQKTAKQKEILNDLESLVYQNVVHG